MQSLKWTFRILKFSRYYFLILSLIALLITWLSDLAGREWFALGAAVLYLWSCVSVLALAELEQKKEKWRIISVILVCFFLLNIFTLPIAILSLMELCDSSVKQVFQTAVSQPEKNDSFENYSYLETAENRSSSLMVPLMVTIFFVANFFIVFFSHHIFLDSSLSIPQLYEKGRDCNSSGNMNCSRAVFERILELNPKDTKAMANLGIAYHQLGDHEKAISIFNQYFTEGGVGVDVMSYTGDALLALDKDAEALEIYLGILEKDSRFVDVAGKILQILISNSEYGRALEFLDGYLQTNPAATPYFEIQRKRILNELNLDTKEEPFGSKEKKVINI